MRKVENCLRGKGKFNQGNLKGISLEITFTAGFTVLSIKQTWI